MAVVDTLEINVTGKGVRELVTAMNNLSSALKKVKAPATKAANETKKIGTAAKSSAKGLGSLMSSLKRIATYRIIRGAIKAITEAFSEGAENAYWFAKAVGDDLATSLDSMSSASFKMKNQIGAAWVTLLQTIQPIIMTIISLVTRAFQVITQFFAALGGRSTYIKAIDYTKEWAKQTGAGAKAAKEWKNQVLGFDEINKLEAPADTGSGGGAALPDYANMFEESKINEKIQVFADKIKAMAQAIGDAFKALWNKLEPFRAWLANAFWTTWDELIGLIENFAALLNGEISFKEFIDKLTPIQTAILSIGTAILVVWGVSKVISGISGLIGALSSPMGETAIVIALLVAAGILLYQNWDKIKAKAEELQEKIQPLIDKFNDAKDAVTGYFAEFEGLSFAESVDKVFGDIGEVLAPFWEKIKGFFTGDKDYGDGSWNFSELSELFWYYLGEALGSAASAILEVVTEALSALWSAFKDNAEMDLNGDGETTGLEILGSILGGILKGLADIGIWLMNNVFTPFFTGILDAFGIESDESVKMNAVGEQIVAGLESGFKEKWDGFVANVQAWWQSLADWWDGLSLKTIVGNVTTGVSNFVGKITGRASGGYVESGQLFVARENGLPEMVGTMGGQTAVANNDQIVAGISAGVYSAVLAAMGNQNSGSRSVILNVNGREFMRAVYADSQAVANEHGIKLVTG